MATPSDDSPPEGVPFPTTYHSPDIPIPPDFLRTPLASPPSASVIDWANTALPKNAGRYAVVLDNVLTPSECETLLSLAEESVTDRGASGARTWRPAMVNVGGGREALYRDYRNSDRIVWDCQEVVDRLWERCLLAEGIRDKFKTVVESGFWSAEIRDFSGMVAWDFARVNQRMRFLKYGSGQFFRAHTDGAYSEKKDGTVYMTFYTVHLYLNDSVAEVGESAELVGGATSFLSMDKAKRVDVNPKAGRVLIFQHDGLYHSGDDVVKGTKYTMRTDIMFKTNMIQ